jgi:hypothetical protein
MAMRGKRHYRVAGSYARAEVIKLADQNDVVKSASVAKSRLGMTSRMAR